MGGGWEADRVENPLHLRLQWSLLFRVRGRPKELLSSERWGDSLRETTGHLQLHGGSHYTPMLRFSSPQNCLPKAVGRILLCLFGVQNLLASLGFLGL